ncbi:MAG: beta-lactamase family protein [Spirochaetales bacterium]|nr:beta-lactamase family protein [Spirochaetales bacterium]MCF7938828.1 beta-lactamase family protein [Spirochaetales bacterium]
MQINRSSLWKLAGRALLPASLVVLLFAGTGCSTDALRPGTSIEDFTSYLDTRIPRLLERYQVPGVSMALVRNGEPVWSGAYGYADLESGQQMTPESICRVESISKSVTAWGVMNLVEDRLLSLDDPVQEHLGGWKLPVSKYPAREVTVERLLSNSAGMPLGTIGEKAEYDPLESIPSLKEHLSEEVRFINKPGSTFLYSNVGFNLLELVIEKVSGQDFSTYMKNQVLSPLGMQNSRFDWDNTLSARLPTGYELDGTPVPPYIYPASAAGGLFATAGDIARFVSAEMNAEAENSEVLSPSMIRRIHRPAIEIPGLFGQVADSYGFGHFIETLPSGRKAVWHGGQGHGWMTHFHAVPETGDGIVILTNSQRSWPFLAEVLDDWALWSGLESVKMGKITMATAILKICIFLFVILGLWQGYRLVSGLLAGERKWGPFSRTSPVKRAFLAAFALAVIAALGWSAAQPYLMVTSIFPSTAGWAGLSLLGLSVVLLLSAVFPRFQK